MANDPQGLCLFGGIETVISADYTMSHGIQPGVCTLVAAPQASFEATIGPLEFVFGDTGFVLLNCKVFSHTFRQDGSGQRWTLAIHDRRWKWAFGEISLNANVRFDNDNLDSSLVMLPQDIAVACLKEMGEQNWDVSGMPNDQRPRIAWDRMNPARALEELATQLGCRVVLGLDSVVRVVPTGTGAKLPTTDATDQSPSITIPDVPYSLTVAGGKTRYQCDFQLRAVGLDMDGTIKAIDRLTYAQVMVRFPPHVSVWDNFEPQNADLTIGRFNLLAAKYAAQSIFYWYRICCTAGDPIGVFNIPGYGRLQDGFQLIPIEDVQVMTYEDIGVLPPVGAALNSADQHSLPAIVYGTYWNQNQGVVNTQPRTPIDGFTVDTDNAMVRFSTPVMQRLIIGGQDIGHSACTQLFLRCAVSVRDFSNWSWRRYSRTRVISNIPTPSRILKHDELVLNYVSATQNNQADVNAQADYYMDAAQAEYQFDEPQQVGYAGIVPISPDGAIQQVAWHIGEPRAWTRASRNNEFVLHVPTYKERRRDEQVKEMIDRQNANLALPFARARL